MRMRFTYPFMRHKHGVRIEPRPTYRVAFRAALDLYWLPDEPTLVGEGPTSEMALHALLKECEALGDKEALERVRDATTDWYDDAVFWDEIASISVEERV